MKKLLAALLVVLSLGVAVGSREPRKKGEKMQFVYVLKLTPGLLEGKGWTEQDSQIIGRHFRRLQQLHQGGTVILAGRTLNESDPSQFGVVIFEAASEEEARKIMEEDDAVKEKVMTAQLFPFKVALGG
ncbi:MAG TPA: YciI family protein [Pyrinomonadaceae bacterium]